MKYFVGISSFVIVAFLALSCQKEAEVKKIVENSGACQAILAYNDGLLMASYGTDSMNPNNTEGLGYISYYKDGETEVIISADGGDISAPKSMVVKDNYLFVADINKILVYSLDDLTAPPTIILFPVDDLDINDLIISGGTLFAAVQNTGRIYVMNVTNPANIDPRTLLLFQPITDVSSIELSGNHMFIGTRPFDGVLSAEHLIYAIDDITQAQIRTVARVPGAYEDILLSADNSKLFFSDWSEGGRIGYVVFETGETTYLPAIEGLKQPSKLAIIGEKLYVADPASQAVWEMPLPK